MREQKILTSNNITFTISTSHIGWRYTCQYGRGSQHIASHVARSGSEHVVRLGACNYISSVCSLINGLLVCVKGKCIRFTMETYFAAEGA